MSSVAGGQHPVLRRCHGEAGIRLQSPFTAPPTSPVSWITRDSRVAVDGVQLFFDRPVQCDLLTVAESAVIRVINGLFITATISGLPTCRHVITIEYKCIPRE